MATRLSAQAGRIEPDEESPVILVEAGVRYTRILSGSGRSDTGTRIHLCSGRMDIGTRIPLGLGRMDTG